VPSGLTDTSADQGTTDGLTIGGNGGSIVTPEGTTDTLPVAGEISSMGAPTSLLHYLFDSHDDDMPNGTAVFADPAPNDIPNGVDAFAP